MPFLSLAGVLFLLKGVASLAAVDPSAVELNDLVSNSSPNDASDNPMTSPFNDANDLPLPVAGANSPSNDAFNSPPLLAAETTSHDMSTDDSLASGTVIGTDGGGVTYPLNDQMPDGASAECMTGTPTAQRRMRRGCVTLPDTHPRTESPHNSPGQDGDTPAIPNRPPLEILKPPTYFPSPDYKIPMRDPEPEQDEELGPDGKLRPAEWICDPFNYEGLRFPTCDSGFKGADILWYGYDQLALAVLFFAHPWATGFGCIEPEELWCCYTIRSRGPDRGKKHDLDHIVVYTGIGCKPYQKTAVL